MECHLDRRMDTMAAEVRTLHTRLDETNTRIEKVETTLLTEFHKWASPMESRLQTHRSWFMEFEAQIEALKLRVSKLEARN